MKLYTATETKKIDNLAIKEKGISGYSLMQDAAEFALEVILKEFSPIDELIIFCSKGKNSGDGFLLGCFAKEFGLDVTVVMSNSPKELTGVSKKAFQEMKESKAKVVSYKSVQKLKISSKAVVVDALIGIGLKGRLRKNIKESILALNKLGLKLPVVSLDIPSGVNPDTGNSDDVYVYADITTTFVAQKRGCFTSIGKKASGEVIYSNLEIPNKLFSKVLPSSSIIDYEESISKIIFREQGAHKGNFGHVLVIGGDKGLGGAALLASKASVFSGAGLTSLVTRPEHVSASLVSCPEVMVKGVDTGQDLEEYLIKPTVIAIGPGLGQTAWSEQMIQRVFWEAEKRNVAVIMDADALNLLTKLKLSSALPKRLILTPHPGEAATLLNTDVDIIEEDRFKAASRIQKKFNATVVLKGSGTIICHKINKVQKWGLCNAGNPGMAKGGMGDVLTGVIAGLLAQGLTLQEASEAGVDLHARAADQISSEISELGLTPSDVIEELRYLLKYD